MEGQDASTSSAMLACLQGHLSQQQALLHKQQLEVLQLNEQLQQRRLAIEVRVEGPCPSFCLLSCINIDPYPPKP